MYESEVNAQTVSVSELPEDVRRRFAEMQGQVAQRTQLPWGEHCTECNWPTCYSSCDLYTPRSDGACRLFEDGMVRVDHPGALNRYVVKIQFKQWGKLYSVGSFRLHTTRSAMWLERANVAVGAFARLTPVGGTTKERVLGKVNYLRRRATERHVFDGQLPECFVLECFNPNSHAVALTMSVRNSGQEPLAAFHERVVAEPGFTRVRIPVSEIVVFVDPGKPFELEIVPNEAADTTLYFGLLDFVTESSRKLPTPVDEGDSKQCKCVVWDLDNTLWRGTLIEDTAAGLELREDVVAVIRELDNRGILQSVASKNNHDDAMAVLESLGLAEYFLYPQIGWQPKSRSIAEVIEALNIGEDTVFFVDDQEFERAEVQAALRSVRVIDALEAASIPSRQEFDVPVTEDSKQRRKMYRAQEVRTRARQSHAGDYHAFLRGCDIRLELAKLSSANVDRVYELAQRTNQMNFSGKRYQVDELRELATDEGFETYVLRCSDRFGNYGVVGFGVFEQESSTLADLMFSCRVQGKRVEHAFLSFLVARHFERGRGEFHALYRKTAKNEMSGRVFEDLGFEPQETWDETTRLVAREGEAVVERGIVAVRMASDRV